jgi:hypothetical protein
MSKSFKDKSTVDLHVSENHFTNTVHAFLACTGCHSDVSPDTHPSAQYATKREFVLHVADACKTCHADEQLKANPLHQKAITKANAPPCSDCHGSHSIRKVPTQKEKLTTTQYCLTCHQQQLSMSIKGETLSLAISEAGLRHSVHKDHACVDCHTRFSKQEHPNPQFSSIREVSIAGGDPAPREHPLRPAHQGQPQRSGLFGLPWLPCGWAENAGPDRGGGAVQEVPQRHLCRLPGQCARQGEDGRKLGQRTDLLILPFQP